MTDKPNTPDTKVTAGVFAGGFSALVAWSLKTFADINMPPEVAIALATVVTFIVQWAVPNKKVA